MEGEPNISGIHKSQVRVVTIEINCDAASPGYAHPMDLHFALDTSIDQFVTDEKVKTYLHQKLLPFYSAIPHWWAKCIKLPMQDDRVKLVREKVQEIQEGKFGKVQHFGHSKEEFASKPPDAEDGLMRPPDVEESLLKPPDSEDSMSEAMFVDEGLGVEGSKENTIGAWTATDNFEQQTE